MIGTQIGGLNLLYGKDILQGMSHPARVRGLKPFYTHGELLAGIMVAPRAGAWIET